MNRTYGLLLNIEGPFLRTIHLYSDMFFTLGCSMAKEHAVFKNKINEYYSTKLNETSFVDKIYDLKSYYVLNLICQKLFPPESKVHCLHIFLITCIYMYVILLLSGSIICTVLLEK